MFCQAGRVHIPAGQEARATGPRQRSGDTNFASARTRRARCSGSPISAGRPDWPASPIWPPRLARLAHLAVMARQPEQGRDHAISARDVTHDAPLAVNQHDRLHRARPFHQAWPPLAAGWPRSITHAKRRHRHSRVPGRAGGGGRPPFQVPGQAGAVATRHSGCPARQGRWAGRYRRAWSGLSVPRFTVAP